MAWGATAQAQEGLQIERFETAIAIQRDNSLLVAERITARLPPSTDQTFVRHLPLRVRTGQVNIEVLQVTDEAGNPRSYSYKQSVFFGGGHRSLHIDPANTYIRRNPQIYIIRYRVTGAIAFKEDHDELNWDVTGTDWPVPIPQTISTVTLPAATDSKYLKPHCFVGSAANQDQSCPFIVVNATTIRYEASKLKAHEGIAIALEFPKGLIKAPPAPATSRLWGFDVRSLVIALATLLWMSWLWLRSGRDPWTVRAIIPRASIPANLRPAEAGFLYDERVDFRDISATLIDLATRGYLKIRWVEEQQGAPPALLFFFLWLEWIFKWVFIILSLIFSLAFTGNPLITLGLIVIYIAVWQWRKRRPHVTHWEDLPARVQRYLTGFRWFVAGFFLLGAALAVSTGASVLLFFALILVAFALALGFARPLMYLWGRGEPWLANPYSLQICDYELTRLREDSEDLRPYEQKLLNALFASGPMVRLSDLAYKFHEAISESQKAIYQPLLDKGYFVGDPHKIRGHFYFLGIALSSGSFILFFIATNVLFESSLASLVTSVVFSLILSGLIICAFAGLMPRKTSEGVRVAQDVLALRKYLAEAGSANVQSFEQLLPYAIVLGVPSVWAEKLTSSYATLPAWYEDSRDAGPHSGRQLALKLRDFSSSAHRFLTARQKHKRTVTLGGVKFV